MVVPWHMTILSHDHLVLPGDPHLSIIITITEDTKAPMGQRPGQVRSEPKVEVGPTAHLTHCPLCLGSDPEPLNPKEARLAWGEMGRGQKRFSTGVESSGLIQTTCVQVLFCHH